MRLELIDIYWHCMAATSSFTAALPEIIVMVWSVCILLVDACCPLLAACTPARRRRVPRAPSAVWSVFVRCRVRCDHSHSIVIAITTIIYQDRQQLEITHVCIGRTTLWHARDGDKQISANQGLVAYDTYFETKPRTRRIMRRKYAEKNVV